MTDEHRYWYALWSRAFSAEFGGDTQKADWWIDRSQELLLQSHGYLVTQDDIRRGTWKDIVGGNIGTKEAPKQAWNTTEGE
eukprot:168085-Alexandrium_andersonii.AAC.1